MKFFGYKTIIFCVMVIIAVGVLAAFFYLQRTGGSIIIIERDWLFSDPADDEAESIAQDMKTLENCENSDRRPFAVMIAEDIEARPLSGIGMADIVVEMPVVTGSITRMMAIFICEDSEEIGSVRSARHDFIPLAQGFDAILAHWGGSHFALDELSKGIIDNLDALPNYFNAFYRKKGVPAPHNGFTSMARMINAAEGLGYRMVSEFAGYKFVKSQNTIFKSQTLEVGYKYPYNVRYEYVSERNTYLRWRGGEREIDSFGDNQVETSNVVLMEAKSRQIDRDYNDVDVFGGGKAVVYRGGEEVSGTWTKKNAEDALRFYDENGREISFAPGNIWINIIEP